MSKTECLFQSFEGVGSIYLTTAKALSVQQLKKHDCKAFILIYGQKKGKGQKQDLEKLEYMTIKTKDSEQNLGHLFLKTFNFITQQKKSTSILIWSPENGQMGSVFAFAYLIMKYGYTLDYLWKLNERKVKNTSISQNYVDQLQKLFNKELSLEEPKKVDELQQTVIGQRILRIRKKYSELAKESHTISEIKKIQSQQAVNPQKSQKKSEADSQQPNSSPPLLKKRSSAIQQKSKKQQNKSADV